MNESNLNIHSMTSPNTLPTKPSSEWIEPPKTLKIWRLLCPSGYWIDLRKRINSVEETKGNIPSLWTMVDRNSKGKARTVYPKTFLTLSVGFISILGFDIMARRWNLDYNCEQKGYRKGEIDAQNYITQGKVTASTVSTYIPLIVHLENQRLEAEHLRTKANDKVAAETVLRDMNIGTGFRNWKE